MGHADYSNLSKFMAQSLYERPSSIAEMQKAFSKKYPKDGLRASEGAITDPLIIRLGMEEILGYWRGLHADLYSPKLTWVRKPIVVPSGKLTTEQMKKLEEWEADEIDDWTSDDEETGDYGTFDSIRWKYGRGWKIKFPRIPSLGNVTH